MSDNEVIVLSDSDTPDPPEVEEVKQEAPKPKKRIKLEPAPEPQPGPSSSSSEAIPAAKDEESNGTDVEQSDSESELDLSRRKRKTHRRSSASKPDITESTSSSASEVEGTRNSLNMPNIEVAEIESDDEAQGQKTGSYDHKEFRPIAKEFMDILDQKEENETWTKKRRAILKQKFRDGVNALDFSAAEVLREAMQLVKAINEKLVKLPNEFFGRLEQLFKHLERMKKKQGDQRLQRKQERRIKALVVAIEACLRRAKEYEEKEVDFNDGYNSENDENEAYCVGDRIKKRMDRYLKEYAKLTRETVFTPRALEHKIRIADVVPNQDITNAVSTYLEALDKYCVPDFCNLRKVVTDANSRKRIGLDEEMIADYAKKLLHRIVIEKKKQRIADFEDAWNHIEADQIEDAELEKRLEEGDKKKGKVSEIIDEYAKKQEEKNAVAVEVPDEEADLSAPESDDNEDSSSGDSSVSVNDDAAIQDQGEDGEIPVHASSSGNKVQSSSDQPEADAETVGSKPDSDSVVDATKGCNVDEEISHALVEPASVNENTDPGEPKRSETNNNESHEDVGKKSDLNDDTEDDIEKDLNSYLTDD